MLTHARLKEVLTYDPQTGEFRWRVQLAPRGKVGSIAGCHDPASGYVLIRIDGALFRAHVLAWFYMTGEWPENLIDHRNLRRSDNRYSNLREATHSQNFQNGGIRKNNTSGRKGVSWDASRRRWKAQICVFGRRIALGRFATKEEAAAAYANAAHKYFGEFARTA